jgi:hypothetical protein
MPSGSAEATALNAAIRAGDQDAFNHIAARDRRSYSSTAIACWARSTTPRMLCRMRCSGVALTGSQFSSRLHGLHCRNRGFKLVVPPLSKSVRGQSHIDVRFDAPTFDDSAPPRVPAGRGKAQNESMSH